MNKRYLQAFVVMVGWSCFIPYQFSPRCEAQFDWLNMSRGAQPRVNPSMPSTNPMPGQNYGTGLPYDPNASAFGTGYGASSGAMASNRRDWKLGVSIQNTEIGAVVVQVAPGSPGQQAGLETNDVIVAVGTSRIGAFDNRVVDLADELRRNADAMGRVSLVVFDNRQRTLQSVPVSMTSTTTTSIRGSVATRDSVQLPYGSVLTVQLQNVSKPYYEVLGGKSVSRADGYGPYTFELNCDPRYMDPRDQFQLLASISSGTQEIYRLLQPVPINPTNPQPINLVLERVSMGGDINLPGNVVNAGYPPLDNNQMTQLFLQLLGRAPSNRELLAWQAYLQQGNSINDLKAKLLSSAQFRERFGNDTLYVQQLVTLLTGRNANQQEVAYWVGRLQSMPAEAVVVEMLNKAR